MVRRTSGGRSGGLLFVLLALFLGYLVVTAVVGTLRLVFGTVVLLAVCGLLYNVLRR